MIQIDSSLLKNYTFIDLFAGIGGLRTAFSANPEDRFSDANAMKEAWHEAVRLVLRRERSGWWRRSGS